MVFPLGFFVGGAGSPNRIVRQGDDRSVSDVTNTELGESEVRGRYQILVHSAQRQTLMSCSMRPCGHSNTTALIPIALGGSKLLSMIKS